MRNINKAYQMLNLNKEPPKKCGAFAEPFWCKKSKGST